MVLELLIKEINRKIPEEHHFLDGENYLKLLIKYKSIRETVGGIFDSF
jgi:hypothetical protein